MCFSARTTTPTSAHAGAEWWSTGAKTDLCVLVLALADYAGDDDMCAVLHISADIGSETDYDIGNDICRHDIVFFIGDARKQI